LTIWHCILSAELTRTHFAHWVVPIIFRAYWIYLLPISGEDV